MRKPSSCNEACLKCVPFHFCQVHQLCGGGLPLDGANIPLDGVMGCVDVTAECKHCIINRGLDNLRIHTWLVPHHTMHTSLLLPPHAPHVLSSPQGISCTQVPTSSKAHPEKILLSITDSARATQINHKLTAAVHHRFVGSVDSVLISSKCSR